MKLKKINLILPTGASEGRTEGGAYRGDYHATNLIM